MMPDKTTKAAGVHEYPDADRFLDKIAERQRVEDRWIREHADQSCVAAAQTVSAAAASICAAIVWATVKICEAIRERRVE